MLLDQTLSPESSPHFVEAPATPRICLSAFRIVPPKFQTDQTSVLQWLAAAHTRAGGISLDLITSLLSRYAAAPERIAFRGHELEDFKHRRWEEMKLFRDKSTIRDKIHFFDETLDSVFDHFYPVGSKPFDDVIHVTCTGYSAPSGAQRLVSARGWGTITEVTHMYHMGCYAAHPAVKMANALVASNPMGHRRVSIAHTEMCSLHFDPANHAPSQLVIQGLFADGFISYEAGPLDQAGKTGGAGLLEILAGQDVIVADSQAAMRWAVGPFVYDMSLSKEIPSLFAAALPAFVSDLFEKAGIDQEERENAIFAIHPGGPKIIERSEQILGLKPEQTRWSHAILLNHGNMSSATLPHIWSRIVEDDSIPMGSLIVSLGAGPGLTLSGMLFRKRGA